MSADTELVLMLASLHGLGTLIAGLLFWMLIRSDTTVAIDPPEEDDGGGGDGGSRLPRTPPAPPRGGGIPLPDARPARVRLREPRRLSDLLPGRTRRPAHDPARRPRVPS